MTIIHNQTKYRHEYKFLLQKDMYLQFKDALSKLMLVDKNSGSTGGYHIRSLYYDDIYDNALKEKLLGNKNRNKFRIRIYNFSDRTIKLEIKAKSDEFIHKKSSTITREEYEKFLSGDVGFLNQKNDQVKEMFYLEYRNNLLRPKVIVDYYREAYILPYNQIRVTFDKDLSAARPVKDMFNNKIFSGQVGQDYSIIMEVKYNNFLPNYVREVLQMNSLNRLAVSKYVLCREFMAR